MIELTPAQIAEEEKDYASLNPLQKEFFNMALRGENLFITGSAGVGKSYLVSKIIAALNRRKRRTIVTATTGVAARNLNGFTLHHQFHLSIVDGTVKVDNEWLGDVDCLVTDEISMLNFYLLNTIGNEIKNFNPRLQIIFIGDFFQLPPVATKEDLKILDNRGYSTSISLDKFHCFHSHTWVDFNLKTCTLTQAMRQDDQAFSTALFNLSRNTLTPEDMQYLAKTQYNTPDPEAVILACKNKTVDDINKKELAKLSGEEKTYKALYWGEYDKDVPKYITLKVGAKVMITINNTTEGYCNGDIGYVQSMRTTEITVKLKDGSIVMVPIFDFKTQIFENGEVETIGGIKQLPVKLAWAMTVHKSQGQTFEKVTFLYDSGFFEGAPVNRTLLYVGLSRAKNIDNVYLRIKGNLPKFCNQDILDFYEGKFETYFNKYDSVIAF